MNYRQLHYAVLLSETRNFSQVAEKLNITQPALSKQILNLEHELGVKLFDRNTNPLTITPAGEYFIREAQELLYKEDQLLRSMQKFQSGEEGKLEIGITPFRSSYLISGIVKKIRKKYPGIQVKLHEAGNEELKKEAADGKYDFAIVNLPVDDSLLDFKMMEPDQLVLVIRDTLIEEFPQLAGKKEIDFKDCEDLPFVVVGITQEMRKLFDKMCVVSGFHPNIAVEVVGLNTAWEMARAGAGATLLPLQFVSKEETDKISVIKIKGVSYERKPVIVTRKGQFISEQAQYAIDLIGTMTKNK